ncbi:MAG: Conserved putative secreted protein [Frankiales bacterium]|nr:Conserved putative secreted protein [Frankiales bacterium]
MARRGISGWTARAATVVLVAGSAVAGVSGAASAAETCATPLAPLSRAIFSVEGQPVDNTNTTLPRLAPKPGDTVVVKLTYKAGCSGIWVGLASYRSPTRTFDPKAPTQELYRSDSRNTNGYLTVAVPTPPGTPGPDCTNTHDLAQDGTGANVPGPYDTTCDGTASANGNGSSENRPCAGCVGNADNKNPQGQLPGPQDDNNGYECDGNNGIANGNPAHSGCTEQEHWQVDLVAGDRTSAGIIEHLGPDPSNTYSGQKRLLTWVNG